MKTKKTREELEQEVEILREKLSRYQTTERRLLESEKRYSNLINRIPIPIITHTSQKFSSLNNAAVQCLGGKSAADFIGKSVWDFVHPDYHGVVKERISQLYRYECSVPMMEEKFITLDKRVIDVEVVANTIPLNGKSASQVIFFDVTGRKLMEKALRTSDKMLRSVADTAQDYIFCKDTEFRYTFINEAMAELLGGKFKDFLGKKPDEIFESQAAAIIAEVDQRAINGEIVDAIRTLPFENNKITFHVIQVPMRDSDGTIIGISGIVRDITERQKVEDKLAASLKEKDILLRELYHRTKNNLQVINSLLSLQALTAKEPKITRAFRDTKNRIRTMALVHEKLYQSGNLSQINVKNYIEDLLQSLLSSFHVNPNRIKTVVTGPEIYLSIDNAIHCGLIINELVSNSIKYAFPDDLQGVITINFSYDEDHLFRLEIQDNGIGFSDSITESHSNTLGLQLVRDLVLEQLEGELIIDGDSGTKITVTFKA